MNLYTFAYLNAPYGDPSVLEFDDRTPAAFAEAEKWPGFIDRAKQLDDIPWMTNFQKDWGRWGPYVTPRFYLGGTTAGQTRQAQTLSQWENLEALWSFVYRGPLHSAALRRRENWFRSYSWPQYCIWWSPRQQQVNWPQAVQRLEHLADHGPSAYSFTFKTAHNSKGNPIKLAEAITAGRFARPEMEKNPQAHT